MGIFTIAAAWKGTTDLLNKAWDAIAATYRRWAGQKQVSDHEKLQHEIATEVKDGEIDKLNERYGFKSDDKQDGKK